MTSQISADSAPIGIFERPFADFTLRRTLEELCGPKEAAAAVTIESRFVVLVPWRGAQYFRCSSLGEVGDIIRAARDALRSQGMLHIRIGRIATPEIERLIDQLANNIEREVRPAPANNPAA